MGSTVTKLDSFQYVRGEIKHEYEVLGSRLTSYITSQSFLVSAFAVSLNNSNSTVRICFPLIVCTTGLVLSWRAQPGIRSAVMILGALHDRQQVLAQDPEVRELDPTDPDFLIQVHRESLRFATVTVMVFSTAWVAMMLLAVYLRVCG
jgi:hypothetical protein